MQGLILVLPSGIWAAIWGGVAGVLLTYYRSGQWHRWGRMLSEIIPAITFSAALAEQILPLNSIWTCFSASILVGGIVGFALDYWQDVGRYFVHNLLSKLSRKITDVDLPPAHFDALTPSKDDDTEKKSDTVGLLHKPHNNHKRH